MNRQSRKRKPRSSASVFGAPWGRAVRLITAGVILVLVAVMVVPQVALASEPSPPWLRLLPPLVLAVGLGVVALFNVRGYVLQGRELRIQRLLWQTRVPLDSLRDAQEDPSAMRGSLRALGNGGLMAFTGRFRNRKLGAYRAFVTDPARCVVLKFKERTIVVSPDDPSAFVNALGFETASTRKPR